MWKKFIDDLDNKPQIICAQESWLKSYWKYVLQGQESWKWGWGDNFH